MLEGNKCELCRLVIDTEKPLRKQTKYHAHCAQIMKTRNTLPSWPPDKRRDYMREYMQRYRHRKQNSSNAAETQLDSPGNISDRATFVIGLPLIISLLSANASSRSVFEWVLSLLRDLHLVVLEAAALAVAITLAWQHLRELWKK